MDVSVPGWIPWIWLDASGVAGGVAGGEVGAAGADGCACLGFELFIELRIDMIPLQSMPA